MKVKATSSFRFFLLVLALFAASLPGRADDAFVFTLQQVGPKRVATGSGPLNSLALTLDPTSNSTRPATETFSGVLHGDLRGNNHVRSYSSGGLGSPAASAASDTIILNPGQPTYDFDFGSLMYGPPPGNDQQTTLAVDSVNGNDANAGTLSAPKLTLQQTVTNGTLFGLYRGSLFRDSLPFATLGTTHGIVVQDVALGAVKNLPIISALDLAPNGSFISNGDGTYSYLWTPTDSTISNDGYANVYAVEINTATEAVTPIASRRRMTDVTAAAGAAGTVWIQAPGTGAGQSGSTTQWKAMIHPSDGLAPGSGTYRYEVVSRVQPADWGAFQENAGDGTMSGLELVGSSSGYGSLGGPPSFVGDRLVFLHATTHGAVIGGGSLQRSVFYESGDTTAIQLAWYAGTGTGLRWDLSDCLFYANVGDRYANALIAHTGDGTTFDRGDISDCAFLGARWSNGALRGTAMDYVNVAVGTINRVYTQGIRDVFGLSIPPGLEVENSVFRAVNSCRASGSFHDNIAELQNGADPDSTDNRGPGACLFQRSGAVVTNNLLWAHTATNSGIPGDDQVGGIAFYGVGGSTVANCTCLRNIIVLDPANKTALVTYLNFGGQSATGHTIDYNLVICTSKAGVSTGGGPSPGQLSWADYVSYEATAAGYDQHSMYVDLSADPRGLNAVFADPPNGDFRWANTDVGQQCAAFCAANNVGPATVTTHWPIVPTVDAAVAAISLLPPKITSPPAVTFPLGALGGYQITTDLDGTPNAPTSYSATGQPAWLSVNASSGLLSGTPPQVGSTAMSVSATNLAGTGSAVLAITVPATFAAWQSAYFTAAELSNAAISGPNATPAGDGVANLLKYALGLAPKSVSAAGTLPTLSLTAAGGATFLTLTYNRSLAVGDVTYTVEVSGDLLTWSSGASATATVSTTNNAAATMQMVVQRDLVPTSTTGRRFIRLRTNLPGVPLPATFAAWQSAYFTAAELSNAAISGPNATPAGDGVANLLKYALGLAPKSVSAAGTLPTLSLTAAGGATFLTLTYNRSLAVGDVTYTVEVSGDLLTWSSGASATATVSTTNNAAATMQMVVQRDLVPTSTTGRRFIRLRVTQP